MKKFLFFLMSAFLVSAVSAHATTLTGTVKYEGKVPSFKPIKMDADPLCAAHHAEPLYPETLVLGSANEMANVFVQIKSGLSQSSFEVPTEPVVVDQKGCQYTPHVFGVMAGQPLKVLNPDGTLHNVHALCKENKEFNMAMPKFRKEFVTTFEKPEPMFAIKCDVHPWMGTWCTVMAHPYFAVTGKDGVFTITNVGPGTYEIEAWHEKLGTQSATVTIADIDEIKTVDFTFSRPASPE